MRRLDEKIGILIDAQIANEGKFAALADSKTHTDGKLDALIDIVSKRENGNALS